MDEKSKTTNSFRITSSIIDDHVNAEKLLAEFQSLKQKDTEAAKKLLLKIKDDLLKHMANEEEGLFPLFESRTGFQHSGPTATLRKEHKQIRTLLKAFENLLLHPKAKPNARQERIIENQLIKFLKAHEEKEEEIFYPWLDKMLPEQEKKAAIAKIR
jgi:iron-sulfur cluster repair protein YtfE (RIC family)